VSNSSLTLLNIFNTLQLPDKKSTVLQLTAHEFLDRGSDFIAKDPEGQPAILIAVKDPITSTRSSPITLEHLVVDYGLECKLNRADGIVHHGIFTVIRCVNSDRVLQEYFIRSMIPVVQSLPSTPTYRDISRAINSLVELFRQLSMPGRKSIQGLWAELFIIASAHCPRILIEAWHSRPEDLYDFNSGTERLEVKSSAGVARLHFFSFEQLHPPNDTTLLVASLFVVEASNGKSVFDLIDNIRDRLVNEFNTAQRIDLIVSATLGNSWRRAIDLKFDCELAASSLVYYISSSIPSIRGPLPLGVSHVHFQADLSFVKPVTLHEIMDKGTLISAL